MSDIDDIKGELKAIRDLLDEIKKQLDAQGAAGSTPVVVPVGTFIIKPRDRTHPDDIRALARAGASEADFYLMAPARLAERS